MKILFCKKRLTDSRNRGILYESHRGVAQFGRALRSGRRGRKFESCHLDHRKCTQFREIFPLLRVLFYLGGSLKFVRHLCAAISKAHEKAGQNITRNRRRRLYFGAVFILCLLVVFPCHKIPQPPGQAGFFIVPTSPRYTL